MENRKLKSAAKWGKIAIEIVDKGWSDQRACVFSSCVGPNVRQWVFAIEFPDLAAFGKARDTVRASPRIQAMERGNCPKLATS